jgi:hypothetical protein
MGGHVIKVNEKPEKSKIVQFLCDYDFGRLWAAIDSRL